ncbi:MAG: fused MFS/spermidine synthase [Geminicoccales bacterium]
MKNIALEDSDNWGILKSNDKTNAGLTASLAIFFLAGIPSLIYQVIWQRLLTLYFGVDIYATTIVVVVFMLGLGIGSLIGGWMGDRVHAVSRVYAIVEVLIGVFGIASLAIFPLVGEAYAGSPLGAVILATALLLLVPTALMGMTLPLMCCVVVTTKASIGPRLAALYGVNALGAAFGALITAYLLIGYFGLAGTTWLAAILNVLLGFLVIGLLPKKRGSGRTAIDESGNGPDEVADRGTGVSLSYSAVLACAFFSGVIALGYEIVWYRVATLLMHGNVYVFGTVLFMFLSSLAIGSLASQRSIGQAGWAKRFAWSQLGIAAYALIFFSMLGYLSPGLGLRHVIAASFFTPFHPSLDLATGHLTLNAVYSALDILFWTVSIITLPAFLMGYGLPNLMREGSERVSALGGSVAGIYFANILGSCLGGLGVGFLLLHVFGTEITIKLLIVFGCAMSLLVFYGIRDRTADRTMATKVGVGTAGALIVLAVFLFPEKHRLIRALHLGDFANVELKIAENSSGVVALRTQSEIIAFKEETKILNEMMLYIDGSRHGSIGSKHHEDVEIKMALAAREGPFNVLTIGLGDSIMVSTLASDPRVESLTVVELNSLLPDMTRDTERGQLIEENADKVAIIIDDGRRWLQANPDTKFDIVMMWPLHAAQAYSGNIFSVEFFETIRAHLEEDGLLFFRSADPFSTARTVASVFTSALRLNDNSYVASDSTIQIDPALTDFDRKQVMEMITADQDVILENTIGAPLNRDYGPNSEYYLTYRYADFMRSAKAPYQAAPGSMSAHVR